LAFLALVSEIGSDLYAISGIVKEKIEKEDVKDSENSNEDQKEDTESENKKSEKEEKIVSHYSTLQMIFSVKNAIESTYGDTKLLASKSITSVIYSPPERF
jgi:hypothetical protein